MGSILSTPTKLHVEQAIECVKAGVPVLNEKPLSDDLDAAAKLVADAKRTGVAVLVGHHRRFNPIIRQAKNLIAQGKIGELRAVHATCWFYKPDDYFEEASWRKQKGAGPISVNLVHDVDLLRYLGGEIECVQAQTVPSMRGFENEDLASALLRFEQGALGTLSVSDSVVSPWSWELTAKEYPIYPATDQSTYLLGGSEGALSVPDLRLWRHEGRADWWSPISATYYPTETSDPLVNQLDHFVEVIAERVTPLVLEKR
ncbi:Gfo/Idh/MocA family protein [Shimia sp.]|uniref:Gfo/Idh/MocA family protein n=1 Tax=Shimia sp. TaxID=1954381 RepID=UPI003BA86D1D